MPSGSAMVLLWQILVAILRKAVREVPTCGSCAESRRGPAVLLPSPVVPQVGPDDDVEDLKDAVMEDMQDIFSSVDKTGRLSERAA